MPSNTGEATVNVDTSIQPAYSLTEAAHYLRLSPGTLRSWMVGRPYSTNDGPNVPLATSRDLVHWSFSVDAAGKKRDERIPKDWVDDVRRSVAAGRAFQDALREVLTANAELLVLRRKQHPR